MSFRIAFYKGTHPGLPGVYNRAVRLRGRGPYSHVELIFDDGVAASSSYVDGGVRFKSGIDFSGDKWDILDLPEGWAAFAHDWFAQQEGKAYDLMGNVFLALGFFPDSKDKYFCSEAVAGALRINQAFRLEPNTLFPVIQRMVAVHDEAQATRATQEAT